MLSNNNERLNIWLKLKDRFSYAEFVKCCTKHNCVPLSILEFAQKAGMAQVSLNAYPNLPAAEAYRYLIEQNSSISQQVVKSKIPATEESNKQRCNSCGGGVVR